MRSVTTDTAARRPRPCADGELPDCKDCPTFRDAHRRAVADHRTSSDYLRILAGKTHDRKWRERLIVAADELDTLFESVGVFDKALDLGAQLCVNGVPVVCKMPVKERSDAGKR